MFRRVSIFLIFAAAAAAEQYGGIIFQRPGGWIQQPTEDGLRFQIPVPNSQILVPLTMLAPQPIRGDFRAAFAAAVQSRLRRGEHIAGGGQANLMEFGKGVRGLARGVVVEDTSRRRLYRLYFGFDLKDRLELIEGESSGQDTWSRLTPAIYAFISGFQFRPAPPQAPAASPIAGVPATSGTTASGTGSGGLAGWYIGGDSSTSFNPNSGNWSSGVSYSYYRFFPDGRVYWGWTLPNGTTMDAFDRAPDPAKVGNHGTYSISGGRIHLIWAKKARSPEHWPFTRERNAITMAGTTYYLIAPCDNLRLHGTWGTSSYTAAGKAAGVNGSRKITFTADGTFRQQGFSGIVGATGAASTWRAAAGSYRIFGNTLELSYAGGREEHSFFRFPHEEDKLIVIDGGKYLQVGN